MRYDNVLVTHGGQSRIYLDHLADVLMAKDREGTLCIGVPSPLHYIAKPHCAERRPLEVRSA